VTWISAAEAQDYQTVITETVENVKRLGPLKMFREAPVLARETPGCAEG
jgi:hypothetical protein